MEFSLILGQRNAFCPFTSQSVQMKKAVFNFVMFCFIHLKGLYLCLWSNIRESNQECTDNQASNSKYIDGISPSGRPVNGKTGRLMIRSSLI